jgi:hypothetical protein
MANAILGTVSFVLFLFLVLVYVTKWRLQIKDFFTGGHEADDFMPGSASAQQRRAAQIDLTNRDRELVANGWNPEDVIAARRNGIELPDKPA